MVALITTIAGIVSACFMPYAGAVIDFTTKRRTFGAAAAGLAVTSMAFLLLLLPSTWLPVAAVCISTGALAYYAHSLARWAYVREIVANDTEIAGVVTAMRIWQLFGQLTYLATVVAITTPTGLDDIQTARVAQGLSTFVATPMAIYAWRTLRSRPAKHELPEGTSLWTAGFSELYRTLKELKREAPGLRKLLFVSALVSAPTVAFTSLAITYLVQQLAVANSQVAIFVGIALISGIPGAFIYRILARATGNRWTMMLGLIWWMVLIAMFPVLLRTPEDQPIALALAVPTGACHSCIPRPRLRPRLLEPALHPWAHAWPRSEAHGLQWAPCCRPVFHCPAPRLPICARHLLSTCTTLLFPRLCAGIGFGWIGPCMSSFTTGELQRGALSPCCLPCTCRQA